MGIKIETGRKNKILRKASKPVERINKEIKNFALDMIKAMKEENGVGLAAPQAGRNIRMIVCRFNVNTVNELIMVLINPKIIELSKELEIAEEGCLSLPGEWGMVERAKGLLLQFTDLKGSERVLEFFGFNARIIQHEIDHLDGVLFVDKAHEITKETSKDKVAHI